MYEGIYLGFPAAFQHLPSPPAWHTDNDGLFDTRLLYSTDGRNWSYIAEDRSAFFGGSAMRGEFYTQFPRDNDQNTS